MPSRRGKHRAESPGITVSLGGSSFTFVGEGEVTLVREVLVQEEVPVPKAPAKAKPVTKKGKKAAEPPAAKNGKKAERPAAPKRAKSKPKATATETAPAPDSYPTLLAGLYEPLLLLHALDPVRGAHTPAAGAADDNGSGGTVRAVRRQFRDDLAFLCEYDKGGDACTALAIEDAADGRLVYWVAANTSPARKIAPFLGGVLDSLTALVQEGGGPAGGVASRDVDALTAAGIAHALPKIKKLHRFLRDAIAGYVSALRRGGGGGGGGGFPPDQQALAGWLQQFAPGPISETSGDRRAQAAAAVRLCRLAHTHRHDAEMRQLATLAAAAAGPQHDALAKAHHNIGRLAHHVRVPARLARVLPVVEDLLVRPRVVRPLPVAACAPFPLPPPGPPLLDDDRLEGLARRLCPPHAVAQLADLAAGLAALDREHGLARRLRAAHAGLAAAPPRVHAEVQVLEHFAAQHLAWTDADRYVACSKPACYCCLLYFRHHALRPVVPASHNKLYCKWGPPRLADGARDAGFVAQRDLLARLGAAVRADAVAQVRARRARHRWQADSATAITADSATAITPAAGPAAGGETDSASDVAVVGREGHEG